MKLLLADDHTLFRDALVQYIERANPDADVTTAESFDQAYEIMEDKRHQDLILLDLRMPGMKGLYGFEKMRENFPNTPVALMSGVAEPEDVEAAIALGAVGYFPKTLSGKALLTAIKSVVDGEVFIPVDHKNSTPLPAYYDDGDQAPPNPVYGGMHEAQQTLSAKDDFNLTPRERDVLEFLITGASNKEIATNLNLQVVTVKLHVRGICRKLDAKNRTQAALIAQEHGLVPKVASGER